ncbi:MAG: hypothetical protein K6E14_11320 [Paludibacteraceae bacterium]|nr:hypothetical protein [Paludibacteraceae bacterium]
MKTRIIKSLNVLCLPVPTEFATEIADKIDALSSCNVTEVRKLFRQGISKIIISDSDREKAIEGIKEILKAYDDDKD